VRVAKPHFVDLDHGSLPEVLPRIDLRKKGAGGYDESWLQRLVASCPDILPIADLEPAFSPAISICTELPLPSGYVDTSL
jgi:hypothetical protein